MNGQDLTGICYPEVVQRNLRHAQGRYMRQSFLLCVALTFWLTSTATQASAATTQQTCGGTFFGSGTIQSPNYQLNYPNDARCLWRLLSISTDTSIRIQFNTFILENDYDYVIIYDERNKLYRYTGYDRPPTTLAGKEARIEFYSDRSNTLIGFTASFSSVNVTSRYQCVTSDAFWCIFGQKCISKNWLCDGYSDCAFNEDELSCPSATPRAIISPQSECQRLGKFWCSWSAQCVPTSYKCDNYNDCVYGEDEANCPTLPRTTLQPCGGTLIYSGTIQSPNYPQDYPNNARCSWRLLSSSNNTGVQLLFTFFNLENNHDFVTIYDERNIAKKYTGSVGPPTLLAGREAKVEFYSDGSNTAQGFTATFVSISLAIQSQCLTSDKFWCRSDQKCISGTWRCDGYPDCMLKEDEEDELLCPLAAAQTIPSPQSDCQRLGKFWCSRSVECVSTSHRCDNKEDCVHGEDEANCATSTDNTTPIVVGTVSGVVVLVILIIISVQVKKARRARQTNASSSNYAQANMSYNNYSQPAAQPSAPAWSELDTYATQFVQPNTQDHVPQNTGVLPMSHNAPPSYDAATMSYVTDQKL